MDRTIVISKIFYAFSIMNFVMYLITRKSSFMACGGLLLIIASLLMIKAKMNK